MITKISPRRNRSMTFWYRRLRRHIALWCIILLFTIIKLMWVLVWMLIIHFLSPFVKNSTSCLNFYHNCTRNLYNCQAMKTHISENIKQHRKRLNLTQSELAQKLNGKKSLISNYENGHSTPDIFILCKLADIFDISLDDLVEYEK